ncbi:MAG: IS982 family transposase, partial [Tannerellaceae bacterium]|nr:IS982 family transposase [Tannerellaceae bacterium]
MDVNIVEIYYAADEFSKTFDRAMEGGYLKNSDGKRHRKRKFTMSDSEVITILTLFHLKQFRNLKAFYT